MIDQPQIRAQGMIFAFIASLFERAGIVDVAEFTSLFEVFAATVAEEDPAEAEILRAWAATVRAASAKFSMH